MSSAGMESVLEFRVNGEKVTIANPCPELCLLDLLREELKLTGCKLGCGEGGCGACTVLVSKYNPVTQATEHQSVVSCLVPVCSLHGADITTVEGIGDTKTKLHPVQENLSSCNGTQCGYCSPGMVMSMYSLLKKKNQPEMLDIEDAIKGNICRCTGYRPILDSFRPFSKNGLPAECQKVVCCKTTERKIGNGSNAAAKDEYRRIPLCMCFGKDNDGPENYAKFGNKNSCWLSPYSLDKLLELKSKNPSAVLVGGNTNVGLRMRFNNEKIAVMISTLNVPEMNTVKKTKSGVEVGGSVSLTELESFLQIVVKEEPEVRTGAYRAILSMLPKFTGRQIKNMSTIGGTVALAMSASDTIPILMATKSVAKVQSKVGTRDIPIDKMYINGNPTVLDGKEVIASVIIPFTNENEYVAFFKQTNRHATIKMCAMSSFAANSNRLVELRLAFSGVGAVPVMALKTMTQLANTDWNDNLLAMATSSLESEFSSVGATEDKAKYHRFIISGFFFKYYCMVLQFLKQKQISVNSSIVKSADIPSIIAPEEIKPVQGSQVFQPVPDDQPLVDSLRRPIPHVSAAEHTTGEAVYVDDMPKLEDELYLAVVHSTRAHAKILSINFDKAMAMEGVHGYVTSDDAPDEQCLWGIYQQDERPFAKDKVECVGQVVAAVVAKNKTIAKEAARLVEVKYEDIKPVILTIEDAIQAQSLYTYDEADINNGDVDAELPKSEHVIEGTVHLSGQKHFYMETQSVIAIPKKEKDEMEIYVSSQMVGILQATVAKCLGVPANKVVCKVKRVGGGFGGKGPRSIPMAIITAIAAKKLKHPVRVKLDRHEDMIMIGARHPFLGIYKVGVSKEGKINALDLKMYSNSGYSFDLSTMVMELASDAIDNCYKIDNLKVTGRCCRTNVVSNTACRGFGAPQGFTIMESIIEHIAVALKLDPLKVREINYYQEGDRTPHHQLLTRFTIPECVSDCIKQSNFYERRTASDYFNSQNRWKKRGLALVPLKFGVGYIPAALNQGGALVHIFTDGAILIAHGGVEMGQGLNTKCLQVATRIFQVSIDKMHVNDNATDKVPNSVPTAASSGSDLFCAAVQNACEILMARLEPFKLENPQGTWEQWVTAAYYSRVNLSATGFYKTPDVGYDPKTHTGLRYNYFTYGVCASQVEIDCLTGDHIVLSCDIVMDVGQSLNPTIDIGQLEGGFVQGYGYYMTEQIEYNSEGLMTTVGPLTYRVPTVREVASTLNVTLLKGVENPRAVYSSKSVSEPPLTLAGSVYFAIKDAIRSARRDLGLAEVFRLDIPATSEKVRLACSDILGEQLNKK